MNLAAIRAIYVSEMARRGFVSGIVAALDATVECTSLEEAARSLLKYDGEADTASTSALG